MEGNPTRCSCSEHTRWVQPQCLSWNVKNRSTRNVCRSVCVSQDIWIRVCGSFMIDVVRDNLCLCFTLLITARSTPPRCRFASWVFVSTRVASTMSGYGWKRKTIAVSEEIMSIGRSHVGHWHALYDNSETSPAAVAQWDYIGWSHCDVIHRFLKRRLWSFVWAGWRCWNQTGGYKPAKVHVSCVSPPLIAHSVSFVFIRVTCRSWMVFFTLH